MKVMQYVRWAGARREFATALVPALLLLALGVRAQEVVPPAITLAQVYQPGTDPAPYWVSEKYDGVRALWDGLRLRARSGREIVAPQWFLAALPAQALDGELWLGRGRFAELSALLRRAEPDAALWGQVRYMVFDLPKHAGDFSERLRSLQKILGTTNPAGAAGESAASFVQSAPQWRVKDEAELMRQLQSITSTGGEGLMLRRADSLWSAGRSGDLLKLKPTLDAEAIVVGYEPGRGRLQGMVGALRVRDAAGREFGLGSGLSDEERRHPPAIGAVVSYRYQSLNPSGLPRFARFWRVREEF